MYQELWRSLGTWSPRSWRLDFAVEYQEAVVGIQSLGSWLVPGHAVTVSALAMRTAVLGLAFDDLGALAAVTSARADSAASLGVSRHLGYQDNGVSLNASGDGLVELRHMRLTRAQWQVSGPGTGVGVRGVERCLSWSGMPPSD